MLGKVELKGRDRLGGEIGGGNDALVFLIFLLVAQLVVNLVGD